MIVSGAYMSNIVHWDKHNRKIAGVRLRHLQPFRKPELKPGKELEDTSGTVNKDNLVNVSFAGLDVIEDFLKKLMDAVEKVHGRVS